MRIFFLLQIVLCLTYKPHIKILTHENCAYSKALIALLDWSGTKYENLDVKNHMDLLKDDNHVPKVFINGKLIGGYQDSLKKWFYVYRKLPYEPQFSVLFNPEYVISKYSNNRKK